MLDLNFLDLKGVKITLCVTSSISFYKAFEILSLLKKADCEVRVAMSEESLKFCSDLAFEALSGYKVLCAKNEDWANGITHIEYAKCDLMIIAPASANTINKIAAGIADNALLSCVLACSAPKLIAPAANTKMLKNSATQNSLEILKNRGFSVIESVSKTLACGDFGKGALANVKDIVLSAARMLLSKPENSNKRAVITAGACYEMIDDVRAITNLSSGKMGLALAFSYYLRGFDVLLISSAPNLPKNLENLEFKSFKSSNDLVEILSRQKLKNDDIFVMCAAISDYVPPQKQNGKMKKTGENLTLELKENIDILGSFKQKCKKIGFKMEMDKKTALNSAQKMLENKGLDAVCLNILDSKNYFGSDENEIIFITKTSQSTLKLANKNKIASQIAKLSESL